MKKVLFVSLALAVGMTGFAQRANQSKLSVTREKPSDVRSLGVAQDEGLKFEHQSLPKANTGTNFDFPVMMTNYDLQSNSALGNRIATWADGSAAVVATWDYSGETSYPDRGTGYNYFDPTATDYNQNPPTQDGAFGDMPEERQEEVKSGWPSIAAVGDGEILVSHASGTNVYYRATKGEGDWELVRNFPDKTWPRVVASGPNDQFVNIVMASQTAVGGTNINQIWHSRSTDGGQTWSEPAEFPLELLDNREEGMYMNQIGADDYVLAANGNNVVVMFGSYTYEVFYLISHDNGATWEKQIVAPCPLGHVVDYNSYPQGMDTAIIMSDNSHAVTIDNNGTVHAAIPLFAWRVSDSTHYSSWPAWNYGILYWNSQYVNEQGGHEIPLYGEWSGDAAHPEWQQGENGTNLSLLLDRLDTLAYANGYNNINIFGWPVDDLHVTQWIAANYLYRTLGLSTMPGISVDEHGNLLIIYTTWSDRIKASSDLNFRGAYVTVRDQEGTWFEDTINLTASFVHRNEEVYYTHAAPKGYDGSFWVSFQGDPNIGLYLDFKANENTNNDGILTDNNIYCAKITPKLEIGSWGINNGEAVNPMNATRVFPNPANDVLNIEVNASQSSLMEISVYNIMGQKVMEENAQILMGINQHNLNISNLTNGIYFVTVKANGFENTMKFVVK